VKEVALPRMADFGKWGVALERSQGWPAGSFLRAYGANLKESAASAADAEPVFLGLMDLMDRHPMGGKARCQDLRTDLERLVPERDAGETGQGLLGSCRTGLRGLRRHCAARDGNGGA